MNNSSAPPEKTEGRIGQYALCVPIFVDKRALRLDFQIFYIILFIVH